MLKCCKCKKDFPLSYMLTLTSSGEKKYLCIDCWDAVVKEIREKERKEGV